MNFNNKHLIYMHIPKCGGSTFISIIKKIFPEQLYFHTGKNYCIGENIIKFKNINSLKREKKNIIHGPMSYGLHKYFKKKSKYITMMREPVQRIISLYNYQLQDKMSPQYKNKLSLEQLLEHIQISEYRNLQTRLFLGDEHKDSIFGHNDLTENDFKTAKKNLKKFCFIGLLEYYDKSIKLLCQKLKCNIVNYTKLNVGKKVFLPDKSLIRKIKKYNSMDIKLYEYAKQIFFNEVKLRHGLKPVVVFKNYDVHNPG